MGKRPPDSAFVPAVAVGGRMQDGATLADGGGIAVDAGHPLRGFGCHLGWHPSPYFQAPAGEWRLAIDGVDPVIAFSEVPE